MAFNTSLRQPTRQTESTLSSWLTGKSLVNNQTESKGWEKRWGVGRSEHHPDVIDHERIPLMKLFLRFNAGGTSSIQQVAVNPSIDNYTTIFISKIKITGIVGVHDILALNFADSTAGGHMGLFTKHNLSLNDSVHVIDYTGATTIQTFDSPQLLSHLKSARSLTTITLSIRNQDGDAVVYDDAYIWYFVETMNWQ